MKKQDQYLYYPYYFASSWPDVVRRTLPHQLHLGKKFKLMQKRIAH